MHFRFNKAALRGLCSVIPLLMSTNVQAAVINGLIASSCGSADSHQNICLVNPVGTGKRQITSGGDNGLPSWSPDGKTLAYTHYDVDPASGMPILQIVTLNISDLSTKPVTSGIAPAWSPDDTQIAFSRPSSTSPSTLEI